jgi:microcin C transport system substrate-binding protein
MQFTITLDQADFQRIVEPYIDNLKKLGVQAAMKVVDDSVSERLLRTFDFDMLVAVFAQSQSPGNEQRDFWFSEAADQEGSNNLIGIKNPAVDALVDAIITANTRRDLVTAVHAWIGCCGMNTTLCHIGLSTVISSRTGTNSHIPRSYRCTMSP